MIDPKELRIGNLVFVECNSLAVHVPKDVVFAIDKVVPQSCHNYDPIPLTPEWLERLGFEKVANYYDLDFNGGGLRFLSDLDECRLFTGSEYSLTVAMDYDTCEIPNAPKYIHQLQNLYFALTGQELTIKELTPTP